MMKPFEAMPITAILDEIEVRMDTGMASRGYIAYCVGIIRRRLDHLSESNPPGVPDRARALLFRMGEYYHGGQ